MSEQAEPTTVTAEPEAEVGAAPPASSSKPVTPKQMPTQRAGAKAAAHRRKWKKIEWAWTLIPVLLLISVAIPSMTLLYALDTGPSAYGATANWHINVTGAQWYWTFGYTDPYAMSVLQQNGVTNYTSVLYVPQNAVVEINVTSIDVIHDFNVPALGVRIDAIPGRINNYWFTIPSGAAPGTTYLIQCTEFCGQGHYAMKTLLFVLPANGLLPPS